MGCVSSTQNGFNNDLLDLENQSDLVMIQVAARTLVPSQQQFDQGDKTFSTFNSEQEEAELVKKIDFKTLIQHFQITYRNDFYTELQTVKNHDIKTLEVVIRALYTQVISEKLMSVNRAEINIKQCKIHIAQSMLSILLESLKFTIKNYSIRHGNALFNRLQKFSKKLCTFLKTKYPRGQDIDAGKLGKQFKEFDCTDNFEHDIIANSKVIFKTKNKEYPYYPKVKKQKKPEIPPQSEGVNKSQNGKNNEQLKEQKILQNGESEEQISQQVIYDQDDIDQTSNDGNQDEEQSKVYHYQKNGDDEKDQLEITNNIKIFLNRIMDEIDRNYQNFTKMFDTIGLNFKVGRKISQNTARCTLLDTGVVEITSIQLARVLVKWLENLDQIISKPEEVLTSNYQIKVAKFGKYNQYSTIKQMNLTKDNQNQPKKYSKCLQKEWQNFLHQQKIIEGLKEQYKKLLKLQNQQKYEDYFKEFSIFILKNLQHSILEQREISPGEMEIVKYSYEISNIISWIVEQKLIAIIKTLTKLSESSNLKKGIPNLIKFKVNDLMRCQLSGNQKTIKNAYDEILKLEEKKEIQIVKIKNRFHTDNHDAMIFFRMKGSFLICECQLALADEQYKNDKSIQYIYELNHFLYQLERSPFGIFGQLSLFLKTQSKTVSSYYNSLKLKPSPSRLEQIKRTYQIFLKKQMKKTKTKEQDNQELASQSQLISLRPYICSICLKYFNKTSNISKTIFRCQETVSVVCDSCCTNKISQKIKQMNDVNSNEQKKQLQDLFASLENHINQIKRCQIHGKLQDIFQPILIQSIKSNVEKENEKIKASIRHQQNKKEQHDQKALQAEKQDEKQKEAQSQKRKQNRIKAEQLMNYFQRIESQAIKESWKIFFAIFSKIGKLQKFVLYRYNSYESIIQNVYSPIEKYLKHEYIQLNDSSKIFLLKNVMKTDVSKKEQRQKNTSQKQLSEIPSSHGKIQKQQDKRTEKFKHIIRQFRYYLFFDYQQQIQPQLKINPQKHQFYFIKNASKQNKDSIMHILIDDENDKGNGQKQCLKKQLQKFPKINNLKKKINLSNLGANDNELKEICNLVNKKEQQKTTKAPTPQQNPYEWIKNIQFLDLTKNKLREVNILSDICPNLSSLDISENQVQKLKFNSELKNLRELKAEDNMIHELMDFSKFKNLLVLNVSENRINKFRPDKNALRLKQLYASDNEIQILQHIKRLKSLQILYLNNNRIKQLDFKKFPKRLRILSVQRNELKKAENVGELQELESISFQDNKLKQLMIEPSMQKLKILKLSKNNMKKLLIFNTKTIEQLYLDEMNLTDKRLVRMVLENGHFQKLQILSLKQNNLSTFPDLRKHMFDRHSVSLKQLRLESNQLIKKMSQWPNIINLNLQYKEEEADLNQEQQVKQIPVIRATNSFCENEQSIQDQNVNKTQQIKIQPLNSIDNQEEIDILSSEVLHVKPLQQEPLKQKPLQQEPLQKEPLKQEPLKWEPLKQEQSILVKQEQSSQVLTKNLQGKNQQTSQILQVQATYFQFLNEQPTSQTKVKSFNTQTKLIPEQNKVIKKNKSQILPQIDPLLEENQIQPTQLNPLQEINLTSNQNDQQQNSQLKPTESSNFNTTNLQTQTKNEQQPQNNEFQQQDKGLQGTPQEMFERDLQNIQILLEKNVNFYIPVAKNLQQNHLYYENIVKIISRFKSEKLRFMLFDKQKMVNNQGQQKFCKLKPQTKPTRVYQGTNDQSVSKNDKQVELAQSPIYIYLKFCYQQSEIRYMFSKAEQAPNFYNFWHPQKSINMKNFMVFDWKLLIYLCLRECQIDNDKWEGFTNHVKSQIPNLRRVNLAGNHIETVTKEQLSKFSKQLRSIWFFSKFDNTLTNRLSSKSISQIQDYNKIYKPQKQVVYNQDEQEYFKKNEGQNN